MKVTYKPIVLDAESDETNMIIAEIDNLIATGETRIERQRDYVRAVASDFEGSMKAIADLETMTSALDMLKRQRARIVRWEEEPSGNR
jgi:predicted  nucleic acid-binding Zn-ribbon protein